MAQARARLPAALAPSETQALAVITPSMPATRLRRVGLLSRTPEAHYLAE